MTSTPRSVILITCGSFNPPTQLHLRLFELAKDCLKAQDIHVLGGVISPIHDQHGDRKSLVHSSHRIEMLELALSGYPFVKISTWETEQMYCCSHQELLESHQAQINDYCLGNAEERLVWMPESLDRCEDAERIPRLMLLCGADTLKSIYDSHLWSKAQMRTILSDYGVVVVSPGKNSDFDQWIFEHDDLYEHKNNIYFVREHMPIHIKSSPIRLALRRGLSVRFLVNDDVINYIVQKRLYLPERQPVLVEDVDSDERNDQTPDGMRSPPPTPNNLYQSTEAANGERPLLGEPESVAREDSAEDKLCVPQLIFSSEQTDAVCHLAISSEPEVPKPQSSDDGDEADGDCSYSCNSECSTCSCLDGSQNSASHSSSGSKESEAMSSTNDNILSLATENKDDTAADIVSHDFTFVPVTCDKDSCTNLMQNQQTQIQTTCPEQPEESCTSEAAILVPEFVSSAASSVAGDTEKHLAEEEVVVPPAEEVIPVEPEPWIQNEEHADDLKHSLKKMSSKKTDSTKRSKSRLSLSGDRTSAASDVPVQIEITPKGVRIISEKESFL